MPRKPREFTAGGIYHVFNRGNNRRVFFECRDDFNFMLNLLASGQQRERLKIFHYCLMSNHYHLLVRIEEAIGLARFMHWVQLGYARYFKKSIKQQGMSLKNGTAAQELRKRVIICNAAVTSKEIP